MQSKHECEQNHQKYARGDRIRYTVGTATGGEETSAGGESENVQPYDIMDVERQAQKGDGREENNINWSFS